MNDTKEKQLEELSKKLFDKTTLKSPSFQFTAQVMKAVVKISEHKKLAYTPLISKKAWFVIGSVFIGLLGFAVFGKVLSAKSWFSTLPNIKFMAFIPDFSISSTALYAIVFFGLMLFIQLPLLKHYFNKRLSV